MIPADRVYLDPGSRISGRHDPPRRCVVMTQWGPGGGPRNVAVRYLDDGTIAVIPFSRRLRRELAGLAARSSSSCSGECRDGA